MLYFYNYFHRMFACFLWVKKKCKLCYWEPLLVPQSSTCIHSVIAACSLYTIESRGSFISQFYEWLKSLDFVIASSLKLAGAVSQCDWLHTMLTMGRLTKLAPYLLGHHLWLLHGYILACGFECCKKGHNCSNFLFCMHGCLCLVSFIELLLCYYCQSVT